MVWSGCAAGITGETVGVSGSDARVRGEVWTDAGGEVEYWVRYGPTTAYGSETEHGTITLGPGARRFVEEILSGLERSTTYHYTFCAREPGQSSPVCGEDREFTTPNVDCGDTITADVSLTADLDCIRAGNREGLTVGADGIDIDLNGHIVLAGPSAIENTGFDDVTIHDGRLYAQNTALHLDGASRNRIEGVQAGLNLPYTPPNTLPPTGIGIEIVGGQGNVVRSSEVQAAGIGLSVSGSTELLVEEITSLVYKGSRGPVPAIHLQADMGVIRRNDLNSSIRVAGSGNGIRSNLIAAGYQGIAVLSGTGNIVAENEVDDAWNPFGGQGDGILVEPAAVNTELRANVSRSNDDDGFDVRNPSTVLADNRATDNADFGIDAVEGVIDLGGNTASGNGNPLQCRNVLCGPPPPAR